MRSWFAQPVPSDDRVRDAMMAEGWTLIMDEEPEPHMEPPAKLAELLGFAAFVEQTKADALAGSLDAAWAEAVAAARAKDRDLSLQGLQAYDQDWWIATAEARTADLCPTCLRPRELAVSKADAATPVAALRAVTAALGKEHAASMSPDLSGPGLVALRKKSRLSARMVAAEMGISRSRLAEVETHAQVTPEFLARYLAAISAVVAREAQR